MALKSYSKHTLCGGWFEERSPGLSRVVADYGCREFDTTSGRDFAPPPRTQDRPRITGMVSSKQFIFGGQATKKDNNPSMETDFGETRADPNQSTFYGTSTHQMHYGKPKKEDHLKPPCHRRKPAGGYPGQPPARTMCKPGCIGEVYKESDEPQRSTQAQRSWLYSMPPELQVRGPKGTDATAPAMNAQDPGDQGLPGLGNMGGHASKTSNEASDNKFPRQITFGLTASHWDFARVNKPHVFQDD